MFSRKSHKYNKSSDLLEEIKKFETTDAILNSIEPEDIKGSILQNLDVSELTKEQRTAVSKLQALKHTLKQFPRSSRRQSARNYLSRQSRINSEADALVESMTGRNALTKDHNLESLQMRLANLQKPIRGGKRKTRRTRRSKGIEGSRLAKGNRVSRLGAYANGNKV